MRNLKISALALAVFAGGFALPAQAQQQAPSSQAQAQAQPQPVSGPQEWIDHMCEVANMAAPDPSFIERRAQHFAQLLQLNESQMAALKDVVNARVKAFADVKAAFCAKKPDLSTFPNRLNFRMQMMQQRLDARKAVTDKAIAFYNGLSDKQKVVFDDMRLGMMLHMILYFHEPMMEHEMEDMGGSGEPGGMHGPMGPGGMRGQMGRGGMHCPTGPDGMHCPMGRPGDMGAPGAPAGGPTSH
ncbi:Spy/CpxP family protein refolding chaperone [Candidatus Rhodoblastus alkanivorans]|uniref:Spy/CpxP family protein refolding chaperone n=1 Tax=Candidatus Rhodoblastus alkanivorans TaxID=2954117 RepID=UPI0023519B96|nr:Spy/CpxP family protein refolding chaperone [Candidatus Rhodoblastus alkanivorans]